MRHGDYISKYGLGRSRDECFDLDLYLAPRVEDGSAESCGLRFPNE